MKLKIISFVLCALSLITMVFGIISVIDNDDGLLGWLLLSIGMLLLACNIGLVISELSKKEL